MSKNLFLKIYECYDYYKIEHKDTETTFDEYVTSLLVKYSYDDNKKAFYKQSFDNYVETIYNIYEPWFDIH